MLAWNVSFISTYTFFQVPRRDVTQLTKGEGQIVRYYAELAADNAISKERKFIVAYYPATAEIAVFERAVSNSGMDSGKFLSKRRLRNPDTNDYFRLEDFHIGATLTICSHRYVTILALANGDDTMGGNTASIVLMMLQLSLV